MSTYVRHMAWLSCTPDKSDSPRYKLYSKGSPYLELPILSCYESFLADLWKEAGMIAQGGMGATSLTWSEIVAWANGCYSDSCMSYQEDEDGVFLPVQNQGRSLLDSELQTVRFMSQEYVSEYYEKDPRRDCPKLIEVEAVDALAESTALGEAFIRLFGKQEQKGV